MEALTGAIFSRRPVVSTANIVDSSPKRRNATVVRTPTYTERIVAELIGTFLLVFVGGGTAASAAVAVAHVNPAVTIGLAAIGRFPWIEVIGYLVGQVIGAVAGAAAILIVYGADA